MRYKIVEPSIMLLLLLETDVLYTYTNWGCSIPGVWMWVGLVDIRSGRWFTLGMSVSTYKMATTTQQSVRWY